MYCKDIIGKLEELSPPSFAEEWDNVGLLLGRYGKEIKRVLLALDVTDEIVEEAAKKGADMIIAHHPLLFSAVKKITDDDITGRRILALSARDICIYAMHTNFDIMGMGDRAADILKLQDRKVLSVTYEDETRKEGIGRYGKLPWEMTLYECAEYVRKSFHLENVRMYGDREQIIGTAAVVPGSGKDYIKDGVRAGAQVFISGDLGHHVSLDGLAMGITLIDGGHYGLEKMFVPYMKEYLEREIPEVELITGTERNPFLTVTGEGNGVELW